MKPEKNVFRSRLSTLLVCVLAVPIAGGGIAGIYGAQLLIPTYKDEVRTYEGADLSLLLDSSSRVASPPWETEFQEENSLPLMESFYENDSPPRERIYLFVYANQVSNINEVMGYPSISPEEYREILLPSYLVPRFYPLQLILNGVSLPDDAGQEGSRLWYAGDEDFQCWHRVLSYPNREEDLTELRKSFLSDYRELRQELGEVSQADLSSSAIDLRSSGVLAQWINRVCRYMRGELIIPVDYMEETHFYYLLEDIIGPREIKIAENSSPNESEFAGYDSVDYPEWPSFLPDYYAESGYPLLSGAVVWLFLQPDLPGRQRYRSHPQPCGHRPGWRAAAGIFRPGGHADPLLRPHRGKDFRLHPKLNEVFAFSL